MKLAIMIVAWASFGGIACPPDGPKVWIHAVLGVVGGLAYYSLMGFRREFASMDFIASTLFAGAVSRFIYVGICPYIWPRRPK